MQPCPMKVPAIVAAIGWWTVVLGGCDSRPSVIKPDERVVLFDTAARLDEGGKHWIIPIHGWIHELENSVVRKSAIVTGLEAAYGLKVTDATRKNFDRRVGLFLVDNERGKRVAVAVGGREYLMPPSAKNGHFHGEISLPVADVAEFAGDGLLRLSIATPRGDGRTFTGTAHLIQSRGVSVISDIDDTVKITEVPDRKKMFEHTFFLDFPDVPGMAALYSKWRRKGARFHFVSSSPWQLYEPLREFTSEAGFPRATFSLKSIRLTDTTLLNLFRKGTETKPEKIEPLLKAYPRRRFVLIGDSGEQDPEVYAQIGRKYPRQIARIYIRDVTGESPNNERFQKVFAGVHPDRWKLFTEPGTLELPE